MVPMGGNKVVGQPGADASSYPEVYTPMGVTAENVAERFGVTREQQDAFAYESQRRAATAREKGLFRDEIVGVNTVSYYGRRAGRAAHWSARRGHHCGRHDPRRAGGAEAGLQPDGHGDGGQRLPAHRRRGGSGGDLSEARRPGPGGQAARLVSRLCQVAGVPPDIMGIGPVPAVRKLLAKNEAYGEGHRRLRAERGVRGAVALLHPRARAVDPEKLNVNGGAIALGHPLGVSGDAYDGDAAARARAPQRDATASSPCASAAAWAPRPSSKWPETVPQQRPTTASGPPCPAGAGTASGS